MYTAGIKDKYKNETYNNIKVNLVSTSTSMNTHSLPFCAVTAQSFFKTH